MKLEKKNQQYMANYSFKGELNPENSMAWN